MTTTLMGPPSKLDEAMITALSDLVAKGNYLHDAAAVAGIDESTLYLWMRQGKSDIEKNIQSLHSKLHQSMQKAKAANRAAFVEVIRDAAVVKREWLPAITYLERTDPEHWGRKDRQTIIVDEHKTVQVIVKHYVEELPTPGQVVEGECKELPQGGHE